jgi:hypothetical protein
MSPSPSPEEYLMYSVNLLNKIREILDVKNMEVSKTLDTRYTSALVSDEA